MLVAQALRRNCPRFHIRCSSRPSACVSPMRATSASSSASPQRRTEPFTGCQLHPSSVATSPTVRPRPAWRTAQRPARVVRRSRGGAIAGSCSVTVPAAHSEPPQRQRRLCHTSTTARPNAGRSTNSTSRSPSDHNGPPHRSQSGLDARRRTCTRNGSPASSSMPSTSTSPSPTNNSQTRIGSTSTGILQFLGCCQHRFWGIPRVQPRTLTALTPTSNAESQQTSGDVIVGSNLVYDRTLRSCRESVDKKTNAAITETLKTWVGDYSEVRRSFIDRIEPVVKPVLETQLLCFAREAGIAEDVVMLLDRDAMLDHIGIGSGLFSQQVPPELSAGEIAIYPRSPATYSPPAAEIDLAKHFVNCAQRTNLVERILEVQRVPRKETLAEFEDLLTSYRNWANDAETALALIVHGGVALKGCASAEKPLWCGTMCVVSHVSVPQKGASPRCRLAALVM